MSDIVLPRRSRRLVLAAAACVAVVAAIVASTRAATADKGPIRIGFLTVKTGALAAGGRQMEEGTAKNVEK
jgi:branched-chain amino acid transport system substrate-binding protein